MAAGLQALCRNAGKHAAVKLAGFSAAMACLVLAGCSEAPGELTPQELADVQVAAGIDASQEESDLVRIAKAVTYYQGIANFCGDMTVSASDDFLDELALSGFSTAELGLAIDAAAAAKAEFVDAEEEYVCTPEMFENSQAAAAEALADWALIKERAQ